MAGPFLNHETLPAVRELPPPPASTINDRPFFESERSMSRQVQSTGFDTRTGVRVAPGSSEKRGSNEDDRDRSIAEMEGASIVEGSRSPDRRV